MTKMETQTSLVSARYKALERFYAATQELKSAQDDLTVIATALEAIKPLVDAPEPKRETVAATTEKGAA